MTFKEFIDKNQVKIEFIPLYVDYKERQGLYKKDQIYIDRVTFLYHAYINIKECFDYSGGPLAFLDEKTMRNLYYRFHRSWVCNNDDRIFDAIKTGKKLLSTPEVKSVYEALFRASKPKSEDLLLSLQMDVNDLDCCFEDWAINLGYGPDSRAGFKVYETCIDYRDKLFRLFKQPVYREFLSCEEDTN